MYIVTYFFEVYILLESFKSSFSSDESDDVVRLRLEGAIGIGIYYNVEQVLLLMECMGISQSVFSSYLYVLINVLIHVLLSIIENMTIKYKVNFGSDM